VSIDVFREERSVPDRDAQGDIDRTFALMRSLQDAPGARALLRVYRPLPTVAFSRRESLMPTFEAAAAAARSHGFAPVIRLAGGRAVAYDEDCLVIDLLTPSEQRFANEAVFDVAAASIRSVLMDLGVDARVGEVPGEYCAGAHSINARGQVKLVGIAQRVTRGARLVTASIVLGHAERLRAVVDDVYAAMGLEWNPATFGTLAGEGVRASPHELEAAITRGLAETHTEWATPLVP